MMMDGHIGVLEQIKTTVSVNGQLLTVIELQIRLELMTVAAIIQ